MKKYSKVCSKDDCFNIVNESDIERDKEGNIYDELTALELILNKLSKLEKGLL